MKREFNSDIDFRDEITITGLPDITIGEIWSNVMSAFVVDVDPFFNINGLSCQTNEEVAKRISEFP